MAKVILHVGFNKCGSTAIQYSLSSKRNTLTNHGYFYRRSDPREDVICNQPQMSVLACILARQELLKSPIYDALLSHNNVHLSAEKCAASYQDHIAELANEAGDGTVLFSSELLTARWLNSNVPDALVTYLFKVFTEVRAVAYIRHPVSFLASLQACMIMRHVRGKPSKRLAILTAALRHQVS